MKYVIVNSLCPFCNSELASQIRAQFFDSNFLFYLLMNLLPFIIFFLVAFTLYKGGKTTRTGFRKLAGAGILMGAGLGGFIDGILFHQIFQIHSMLSAKLPQDTVVNIKTSMVWDGLFHMLTWITTVVAIKLFWNTAKNRSAVFSGRVFMGSVVFGWGFFNLVEGSLNHHLIEIHHVFERQGVSSFDYIFLGAGILLMIFGLSMILKEKSKHGKLPDELFTLRAI